MRYRKYHVYLDILGLLGLGLALSYYRWGHIISLRNEELANIWLSISMDIVGIWLSVRIIDYILQKNKKEESARLFTAQNMRFLVKQTKNAIEFAGRLEVDSIKNELSWSKGIFDKRRGYFSPDEVRNVEAFFESISSRLPELEGLITKKTAYYDGKLSKEELEKEKAKHWSYVSTIEEAEQAAEKNILSETEEA